MQKGIGFVTATTTTAPPYPIDRIRADFPILKLQVNGKPLVYLDNAATSQKPQAVIDALSQYYSAENANVHRGVHYLSELATNKYEAVREKAAHFLGAPVVCNVIFTGGTTDGLNMIAQTYGRANLREGDEILISYMEHHSNIVPWQMLCEQTGAKLRVVPINDQGELIFEEYEKLLNSRTKMVSVVHVSNALGTVNPVRKMADLAHAQGAIVVVDGAQSAPHMKINVRELGCDFFVCSAHKIYGPTGLGLLYGRGDLLDTMPPWRGGGDMILSVTFEKTTYNRLPYKFEAGTPHIGGIIAFGAALDYLEGLGMEQVSAHEQALLAYGTEALAEVPGLRPIGTAAEKAGVLSFVLDSAHPHDIGQLLNDEGVAVRAGHHCAQPVMKRFGVPATARASLGIYNTRHDIDALVRALHNVNKVFA